MDDRVLHTDVADRVATVTLNRPTARNALNRALRSALARTMALLNEDDGVDVIILTGADPAFCAGLDPKELGSGGGARADEPAPRGRRVPFGPVAKPLIGAVNGVAITGGLEIALLCDFLIASERARFADTHTRVGVQPGWGLTVMLPQAVGLRRAREMSVTGNFVDAHTAAAWGLVNRVVPHDQLLPTGRALAADVVSNDPAGVRWLLRTYARGSETTAVEAWEIEAAAAVEWYGAGGGRPEEVERRRAGILDRGRGQHH
jgi:enoyl-CoA hydratase